MQKGPDSRFQSREVTVFGPTAGCCCCISSNILAITELLFVQDPLTTKLLPIPSAFVLSLKAVPVVCLSALNCCALCCGHEARRNSIR